MTHDTTPHTHTSTTRPHEHDKEVTSNDLLTNNNSERARTRQNPDHTSTGAPAPPDAATRACGDSQTKEGEASKSVRESATSASDRQSMNTRHNEGVRIIRIVLDKMSVNKMLFDLNDQREFEEFILLTILNLF